MTDPALTDIGKEALRDLLANLTQAKAFVLDQAPEFCRQLIARDVGLAVFGVGTCIVGAVICAFLSWVCIRGLKEDDGNPGWITGSVFSIMGTIGALVGAFCCAYQGFYIYLAPKVYLVEQLMKMVK